MQDLRTFSILLRIFIISYLAEDKIQIDANFNKFALFKEKLESTLSEK